MNQGSLFGVRVVGAIKGCNLKKKNLSKRASGSVQVAPLMPSCYEQRRGETCDKEKPHAS